MEQVIVNGLYLGAQYALIALGLTLIFALMNVLNFAHGQMYVLGGFITYTIYGQLGLPFAFALLCSGVTLALLGALFEKFLFRTVIKRSLREESTMLLAAATALFLDAVILLLFGAPKIPQLARSLGQSMRILKTEIREEPKAGASGTRTESAPAAPAVIQPVDETVVS